MSRNRYSKSDSGNSIFDHLVNIFKLEIFLVLSFIIFFVARSSSDLDKFIKDKSLKILKPSIVFLDSPFWLTRSVFNNFSNIINVYSNNEKLKLENDELRKSLVLLEKNASENLALKSLLNFNKSDFDYVSARIFLNSGFAYNSQAVINLGSLSNIKKNQVVISGKGLVGRVYDVYTDNAHLLLYNDPNSRISVYSSVSRERAIMFGDYNNLPYLEYLKKNHSLQAGELLYTSGDGGVFYPDIPVGVVVEEDGRFFVKPFVSFQNIDFVSVITKKVL